MQPLELHRTGPVVKTSCRIHTEVEVVLAMHHISYAVMHPTHTHFKSPRKQRDAHVHHRTIQYKASRRLNTTRSGLFKGERKKMPRPMSLGLQKLALLAPFPLNRKPAFRLKTTFSNGHGGLSTT